VRLWQALREAEPKVASPLYRDDQLGMYLTEIVGRLTPESYKTVGGPPLRVVVIRDPRLNAFAMGHGLVAVNTGILGRVDNEVQLAAVLAHELSHITNRHSIRKYRALQNQQTAINVAAVLGALALTAAAVDQNRRGNPAAAQAIVGAGTPLLQVGLSLSLSAMVNGYSREMESEADQNGLRLMAEAGYPPIEMANFFRKMQAELPDRGSLETFFWGSHPRAVERIAAVEASIGANTQTITTTTGSALFETRIRPVRLADAEYNAFLGRGAIARSEAERTLNAIPSSDPRKPAFSTLVVGMLWGAVSNGARYRGDGKTADDAFGRSAALYERAAGEARGVPGGAPLEATSFRLLGLLHYGQRNTRGRACDAKEAFEKYLQLAPAALDRPDIMDRVRTLSC
jgi:hypothetical protein